jgi:hypothetical protein
MRCASSFKQLANGSARTISIRVTGRKRASSEATAHDASRYEEANWTRIGGSLYQTSPVSMTQGQSATCSMWMKPGPRQPAASSINLNLWALAGSPTPVCQIEPLTGQRQQFEATLTIPSPTSTLRAQVFIPPSVTIDFDGGVLKALQGG